MFHFDANLARTSRKKMIRFFYSLISIFLLVLIFNNATTFPNATATYNGLIVENQTLFDFLEKNQDAILTKVQAETLNSIQNQVIDQLRIDLRAQGSNLNIARVVGYAEGKTVGDAGYFTFQASPFQVGSTDFEKLIYEAGTYGITVNMRLTLEENAAGYAYMNEDVGQWSNPYSTLKPIIGSNTLQPTLDLSGSSFLSMDPDPLDNTSVMVHELYHSLNNINSFFTKGLRIDGASAVTSKKSQLQVFNDSVLNKLYGFNFRFDEISARAAQFMYVSSVAQTVSSNLNSPRAMRISDMATGVLNSLIQMSDSTYDSVNDRMLIFNSSSKDVMVFDLGKGDYTSSIDQIRDKMMAICIFTENLTLDTVKLYFGLGKVTPAEYKSFDDDRLVRLGVLGQWTKVDGASELRFDEQKILKTAEGKAFYQSLVKLNFQGKTPFEIATILNGVILGATQNGISPASQLLSYAKNPKNNISVRSNQDTTRGSYLGNSDNQQSSSNQQNNNNQQVDKTFVDGFNQPMIAISLMTSPDTANSSDSSDSSISSVVTNATTTQGPGIGVVYPYVIIGSTCILVQGDGNPVVDSFGNPVQVPLDPSGVAPIGFQALGNGTFSVPLPGGGVSILNASSQVALNSAATKAGFGISTTPIQIRPTYFAANGQMVFMTNNTKLSSSKSVPDITDKPRGNAPSTSAIANKRNGSGIVSGGGHTTVCDKNGCSIDGVSRSPTTSSQTLNGIPADPAQGALQDAADSVTRNGSGGAFGDLTVDVY